MNKVFSKHAYLRHCRYIYLESLHFLVTAKKKVLIKQCQVSTVRGSLLQYVIIAECVYIISINLCASPRFAMLLQFLKMLFPSLGINLYRQLEQKQILKTAKIIQNHQPQSNVAVRADITTQITCSFGHCPN